MNEHERLCKLLDETFDNQYAAYRAISAKQTATDLLANGVIALPCKVGDTVYRISKRYGEWRVLPRVVCNMTYSLDHFYRPSWRIFTTTDDKLGETVFITREEAECAVAMKNGTGEVNSDIARGENAKRSTTELLHELTTHMQAVDNGFLWIHTVDGVTHFDVSCGEVISRLNYLNEKNLADVLTRLKQTE